MTSLPIACTLTDAAQRKRQQDLQRRLLPMIRGGSRACRAWRKPAPYLLAWATCAVALAGDLRAQASPRWNFRLDGGQAEIHRAASDGWVVGGALGRGSAGSRLRLELGLAGGTADEGFLSANGGVELRLLPESLVTPIVAAHAGLLTEPEYAGWVADVAGGLVIRTSRDLALRGAVSRGTHGGESGPHTITIGLEVAFGGGR